MKAPKKTISHFIKLLMYRSSLRGSSERLGMAFITLAVVSYESSVSQALSILPYAVTTKFSGSGQIHFCGILQAKNEELSQSFSMEGNELLNSMKGIKPCSKENLLRERRAFIAKATSK